MKNHPIIRACWFVVNILLLVSLVAVIYGVGWEFSTRSYLKGFSDAIIPASDNPEQKIEAILQWMAHGPVRRSSSDPGGTRGAQSGRNAQLSTTSGSLRHRDERVRESGAEHWPARATASPAGSERAQQTRGRGSLDRRPMGRCRPLIPFYPPASRRTFSDAGGVERPRRFPGRDAIDSQLSASYTYESTVHVRLARIPWIGKHLRGIFNFIWPPWEEAINWTLLVERESFAMLVASIFLLCFALAARLLLGWYCRTKLGIARERLRDQILRAGHMMVGTPH